MPASAPLTPLLTLSLDYVIARGETPDALCSFLRKYSLRHGKIGMLRRVCSLSAARRNGDISRRRFKFELVRTLLAVKDRSIPDRFADSLVANMKPEVRRLIDDFTAAGGKIALVTSAPGEVARRVARRLNAEFCISTPTFEEFRRIYPADPIDYDECQGMEKSQQLADKALRAGCRPDTVVTGEPDDIFLLRLPGLTRRILSPAIPKNMQRNLCRENISFELL